MVGMLCYGVIISSDVLYGRGMGSSYLLKLKFSASTGAEYPAIRETGQTRN